MLTASVIIPTYNRPDRLARCLAGLCGVTVDRSDYEIIVVDDGGTSELDAVLRPYADRLDVHLVRQPNAGPAAARNRGAQHAAGHILAFTDDDCVPEPDWLTELLLCHDRHPDSLVGGRTVNALGSNLFAAASQDLVSYLYEYYEAKTGAPAFFTSNNMAVRRDMFLELGGFNTEFRLAAGEDRELSDRWLSTYGALRYTDRAIIRHYHHLNLRRFWRQHSNYGRGAYRFHELRAQRDERHGIEPLSFYLDLMLFPLRQRCSIPRALAGAALMAISQAANAAGYYQERHAARGERRIRRD
jgi:GT2 family glycosyltransferase